ncbi:glycoside hydrolase family 27 protein [Prevotella denticola]|uniref:glycoside hydrolase family 27 protein n=1 Tax=Prevotella denticola TaxID=28129 RepID=UPI00288A7EE9|nr:glycoside hydrolase family 27 protein [Prevotella denticola]
MTYQLSKLRKAVLFFSALLLAAPAAAALGRDSLELTPPMGFMTWNKYKDDISEQLIRRIADRMLSAGYAEAGYKYIFIDDGWQGGRDKRNNIIPDPVKFPSGMKALADYVHSKGLLLGIYSDAARLTCAGYTGSYGFEKQDAKTFAEWGIDYLKYDYCHAPSDSAVAHQRYRKMGDALQDSGRKIALGVCEWGQLNPERWARQAGGSLWRVSYDVRDMWKDIVGQGGMGILDIIDITEPLYKYAGPGHWLDMDMLIVGLDGKGGPSSDLGGVGCTYTEYQTQMSMWCMFASPLAMSHDLLDENEATRRILLNKEMIAINQDALGEAARRVDFPGVCRVYLRRLSGNRLALAVMNPSGKPQGIQLPLSVIGKAQKYAFRDVWEHKTALWQKTWQGDLQPHETKVFTVTAR